MITDVDPQTGVFRLRTGNENLTPQFPPESVQSLNAGDRVDVVLAFARGRMAEGRGQIAPHPAGG